MNDDHLLVMRNGNLSVGARLLWWELNQWITDDLSVCFPSQAALAENLGVSRASIIRWMQELSDDRLVTKLPQSRGNAYELNAPVVDMHGMLLTDHPSYYNSYSYDEELRLIYKNPR